MLYCLLCTYLPFKKYGFRFPKPFHLMDRNQSFPLQFQKHLPNLIEQQTFRLIFDLNCHTSCDPNVKKKKKQPFE